MNDVSPDDLPVADWPVDVANAVVVGDDGVLARSGPGDPLPWASVTKLLTALTALTLIDDGTVGLDDPAGPPEATVADLLAHTSGLPFDGDRPVAAPGGRRVYSNTGIDVLADLLATRTGRSFPQLLSERVVDPLAMTVRLTGPASHGGVGTIDDLAVLAAELLAPTLVGADLMTRAISVHLPGLKGVLPGFGRQEDNSWGLGMEIRGHKSPHWTGSLNSPATFGHFGQSGSFLWVDPVVGIACASLSDRTFGPWAAQAWPALSDHVLRTYAGL